ncbi:MAG TPA: hypothetical protein VGS97_16795 [Actinocrinis sp.]|uniref:hypothetical protein n=1 Tax=Actinocrinis sp. TaxID=1920516 RepID=UPI002DDD81DD|nr:hypothetical protein [Actinocrinis sp.]HEV2345760.1 hypothetical protein [Actinocrinis sp.]
MSAEEDLKSAYEAFKGDDYATASQLFYKVYQSPEVAEDEALRRETAWNLGLACALQDDLEASRGWFQASGYGPEKFEEQQLGEFYRQVVLQEK